MLPDLSGIKVVKKRRSLEMLPDLSGIKVVKKPRNQPLVQGWYHSKVKLEILDFQLPEKPKKYSPK